MDETKTELVPVIDRDAGAAADPRRPPHRGGRGPGPKLLPFGRRDLRTLGHSALEPTPSVPTARTSCPSSRSWDPLARGLDPALHGLGRRRPRVPRRMLEESKAPKTINRRIASLSSFYKYLQGVRLRVPAADHRPNPAHAQFIARGSSDPRDETKALSATRARQLMGLPSGDSVFDFRDRAIIKFFLYSGARIGTAVA